MTSGRRNGNGNDDVVVVLCTAPPAAASGEQGAQGAQGAQDVARQLVAEKLCACVNVVAGVTSFFWWEGKVDRGEESLLVIKTTRALLGRLQQRLLELHPYDLPEVLVLEVSGGHPPYLAWVAESVRTGGTGGSATTLE